MKVKSKRQRAIIQRKSRPTNIKHSFTMAVSNDGAMPSSNRLTKEGSPGIGIEELSAVKLNDSKQVPPLFTTLPPIKDTLVTDTSVSQDETVSQCLLHLTGTDPSKSISDFTAHGVPRLESQDHVDYLKDALEHARYIAYDAARPWVVYWALLGLSLLGQDITVHAER